MRRAPLVSQHGKGTDWVSSVSQLSVTCIPCEPSSSSLGTRHPGSSPRSGRSRKVSGQGHPHDSPLCSGLGLCCRRGAGRGWYCSTAARALGGAGVGL